MVLTRRAKKRDPNTPASEKPEPKKRKASASETEPGESSTALVLTPPPIAEEGKRRQSPKMRDMEEEESEPAETAEKSDEEEEDSSGEETMSDDREGGEEGEGGGDGEEDAAETEEESDGSDSDSRNSRRNADAWAEKEALKPVRMYFPPEEYSKSIKLSTRCYIEEVIKTFNELGLSEREIKWFEEHPQFRHIMHIPKSNHMVQPMWMLLLRTAEIKRKKEAWFVVNGIPIRYGLREHALISGLDCHNYPLDWKRKGDLSFKNKYFPDEKRKEKRKEKKTAKKTEKKKEKTKKILREDVRELLKEMGPDDTGDRLKMAVLYFLSSIIYCPTKTGQQGKPVLDTFVRYVSDLELCKTFPWGRFSYDLMLESIHSTVSHYVDGVVSGDTTIPGFCLPFELLALEAIPELKRSLREPVTAPDDDCPRMCRSKWQKSDLRGWPLETVYEKLGETKDIQSVLIASEEEKVLLDSIMEAEDDVDEHDPVVQSWDDRIHNGFTVEFQDMLDEDVNGRAKKEDETEATGGGRGARKTTLAEMVGAVHSLIEQIGILSQKIDDVAQNLEDRIKPLEEYVNAQKGNVE